MTAELNARLEAGKATETDLICEQHLAHTTGQPTLDALLRHADKFGGDSRDILSSAMHLAEDQYAILSDALARKDAAAKKARFS